MEEKGKEQEKVNEKEKEQMKEQEQPGQAGRSLKTLCRKITANLGECTLHRNVNIVLLHE